MSPTNSPVSRSPTRMLERLPTLLRTLRWIRPAQARAQIHHTLFGVTTPIRSEGAPPSLAVSRPITDFLLPPAHVKAWGGDRIELLAVPFELGAAVDWTTTEHGPLFAYHLHQHEYLRTESFDSAQRTSRLLDWIDRHSAGAGWDPHPISLRLLCWGKLLATPGMLEGTESSRQRILASMADQAETLSRGLEFRLQANHLLSNLISVVWAGVLLDGASSSRWLGLTPRLIDEIDAQIHPDGGHEERSPMYHALLLENLLDLLNLCRSVPGRAPEGLVDTLRDATSRMLDALRILTHPDQDIALFADSAFGIAATPAALLDYAQRLGVVPQTSTRRVDASAVLSQTGFVRLVARDSVLLASVAAPAPAHQPGHAHCDALAFELSLGGRRVVTDTGLYEYRPGLRRERARTTRAHSTLQFDDQEQAEIWSAHRIGGRPVVELLGWDGESRADASCRGWSRRQTLHRRSFRVDARTATIVDRIDGPCDSVRSTLPIDPDLRVTLDAAASKATAVWHDDAGVGRGRVEFELPTELRWHLERGPYYPSFGRVVERDILVGEGAGFASARLQIALHDE